MNILAREILFCALCLSLLYSINSWAQTAQQKEADENVELSISIHEQPSEKQKLSFVRLKRDGEGQPTALQTATARYKSSGGVTVDLVGVIHIGDGKYYNRLNEQFKQYDVVLYELVAPEGTRIPRGGRQQASGNPISMIQGMAKSVLGLESQMDYVDYTADNFVHADMSPADMAAAMRARGDNALTFTLSAVADAMRQANLRAQEMERQRAAQPQSAESVDPSVDLVTMLTDANAGSKLKIQMAEQFGAAGGAGMSLGATLDQSILSDRNKAAMQVFKKQLAAGNKRIAIFYGAAHMPDFEQRLVNEYGFKKTDTQWLTAWDLTAPGPKSESPLSMMLKLLGEP